MNRKSELKCLQSQREELIQDLRALYRKKFDSLKELNLSERTMARLVQMMLQSQEGAISPLHQEIEKPLITKAPSQKSTSNKSHGML